MPNCERQTRKPKIETDSGPRTFLLETILKGLGLKPEPLQTELQLQRRVRVAERRRLTIIDALRDQFAIDAERVKDELSGKIYI